MHPSQILYEDNHLLIVNKPADWIVQGASTDQRSLLESSKIYIKSKYHKPGNVYLGVVSRLDAPVTGAVPFARTSKAAARLSQQFRDRTPTKLYWAITEGIPNPIEGRLEHWLVRNDNDHVTRVTQQESTPAHRSIMEYRVLRGHHGQAWLEIRLITGRKHQIRCQLSAIDCPILGDALYGAVDPFAQGIALHCRQLMIQHPTLNSTVSVVADLPIYWPSWARPEA
ncbi:MAG: RNA pseudouridine synthase [Planctomycetota bacterium]